MSWHGLQWKVYDNLLEPQRNELAEAACGQMINNQIVHHVAEAEASEHKGGHLALEKKQKQSKSTSKGVNNGRRAGKVGAFQKGVDVDPRSPYHLMPKSFALKVTNLP